MRLLIGLVVGSALVLGACASTYRVSPVVSENQLQVAASSGESLRSSKKHVVEVGAIRPSMRQFDSPRFNVRFKNQGKEPLEFSTENVSVTFNGSAARVLSYEAQIQDVQNRLAYYGMRAPIFYNPAQSFFYHQPLHYQPFGSRRGGFLMVEDFNDRIDVQQALADLDYIQKNSLKPRVVRPGQEAFGEIVVGSKLGASSSQSMVVTVVVDDEQHQFTFGYDELK
ncbi:hypothetical protein [Limnobacter sp.]|uniref:hypothetical protein n=1 Tax=Limnobacter sp. TaxID=2003368 RepID=UPI0035196488